MKAVFVVVAGIVAGTFSQVAVAFQETGGKAAPDSTTTPSLQMPSSTGKPGISLSAPEGKPKSGGPEIRVPGLGTIGALPKLDFGLELLYGASEPKGVRDDKLADPSDLQIRGTMKYKFGN
jgi:hypothetical protein